MTQTADTDTVEIAVEVDGAPRRFSLRGSVFSLGRDPSCHVVIDDDRASRVHARVSWNGTRWMLEDRSLNGTWLDGARLQADRPVALRADQEIRIERHQIRIRALPRVQGVPTQRAVPLERIVLRLREDDCEVVFSTATRTRRSAIPPQQARHLALLLRGPRDGDRWGWVEKNKEFSILDAPNQGSDPNARLYQSRSRLQVWWNQQRELHTDLLSDTPSDLFQTKRNRIRLIVRVQEALVIGPGDATLPT